MCVHCILSSLQSAVVKRCLVCPLFLISVCISDCHAIRILREYLVLSTVGGYYKVQAREASSVGCCIDTSDLYKSCFTSVGLHPYLLDVTLLCCPIRSRKDREVSQQCASSTAPCFTHSLVLNQLGDIQVPFASHTSPEHFLRIYDINFCGHNWRWMFTPVVNAHYYSDEKNTEKKNNANKWNP